MAQYDMIIGRVPNPHDNSFTARWLARGNNEEHEATTILNPSARLLRVPDEARLQVEVLGEKILRFERRLPILLQRWKQQECFW